MSDKTTENDVVEQEHETGTAHPKDVRNSPIFSELREKNRELEKKLAEIEAAREDATKKAEQKKLEEEGRYKEVLSQKEAELEAIKASHQKAILSKSLENSLIREGVSNPMFVKGVVSSYEGDEEGISEYVASLKKDESNAMFFSQSTTGTTSVQPAPVGVSPAVGGSTDWSQLKQSLRDPNKAREASQAITDYYKANGRMPPGFE